MLFYGVLQQLVHGINLQLLWWLKLTNRKLLRTKLKKYICKNFFSEETDGVLRELETMPYAHWLEGSGVVKLEKGGGFLIKPAIVKKLKAERLNLFCMKFTMHSTK